MNEETNITRGSGNVFADLGYGDADAHSLKAQLVSRINEVMSANQLSQSRAAEIMEISQPDLSRYLKGKFRDVSVERLMRMLARLGCTVDIVIEEPGSKRRNSISVGANVSV